MRIFVTGCAGFIGSHLCEYLLAAGHTVHGLDNFDHYYDPRIKEAHVQPLQASPLFKLVRGDIRDGAVVEQAWDELRPERVIHLAARAGVRPSIADPALYSDVNVTGTIRILEAARKTMTPVVFASSSSVYGGSSQVPYVETDPVDRPVSPYAATKRGGELLAATYHHLYGLPVTCLRFFTVYGPRQRPDMAIHKFARAILEGEPITLFGDGTTARDYTYISDILSGIVAAAGLTDGFDIFNLGNSRTIELRELVALLERITEQSAVIRWKPEQPGDMRLTCANIEHARKKLAYHPKTSMEEGLRRTVEWLRCA